MSSNSLAQIVNQINEAVEAATQTPNEPEKKLRELVSPIWNDFLRQRKINLNLIAEDELTLANGRADTVFNKLILEYKKPNTIRPDNSKNRKLLSQVQGYILDIAEERRFKKERLLGVLFDGSYFIFMRYARGWRIDEPESVSEKSLERFLTELERLTKRIALIPENLIHDFAIGRNSRNKVAVDCIKAFYHEVNQHGDDGDTKEHVFFEQWKVQFAEVHGTLEQKNIDKERLFTSYGFSKNEQKDFNVYAFFFALDSYYAVLMKLLSYQVVGFYTLRELTGLPLHDLEKLESSPLRQKMADLEEGGIFRNIGIRNFLEGDLFSWYTETWNDDIYLAIKQIIAHLNDYDPETMEVAPDETRDILKKLYQYLVPKQIRHDLGEYYTPDWLAERCLNQLNYNGDPKYRILDPSCGSGTFPILAIKRAKEYAIKKGISPKVTLKNILKNIFGFDLNPLAVISARTNYMLAIADLLKFKEGDITIPIYLCDSINPPEAKLDKSMPLFPEKLPYLVKTTVGSFYFSHSIITKHRVQHLANIIEDSVKSGKVKDDFLKQVEIELKLDAEEYNESELYLDDIYEKLVELDRRGINGIWARIIKNAFAPLFVGQFDMVVGNPPWVNWEALPENYREDTKPLWINYGLFSLSGHAARLGGGKKDISMLMTYVAIDKYLKDSGKLCFVITQTLFKTQGAGDGFRRFQLGVSGEKFKIEQVDDMIELQPFEGATNRTAIVSLIKGIATTYPLSYVLWRKRQKGVIPIDMEFNEVLKRTSRSNNKAEPISDKLSAPWMTGKPKAIQSIRKIIGNSEYKALAGSCTWLNGVYWGKVTKDSGNFVLFENEWDIGKIKVNSKSVEIEKGLVFPLLRGREINRWISKPTLKIIVTQDPKTRIGYDKKTMQSDYPKTLDYLKHFQVDLEGRSGYKKYLSGAPYKVVWKEQAKEFQCTVVSNGKVGDEDKIIIPDHKLMFVPFTLEEEAHFVAACLHSTISIFTIMSYVVSTQQSTHILNNIAIPKFNSSNSLHRDLSNLSQHCHEKVAAGIDVTDLEEQIDELVAEMWNLTKDELKDIQESMDELRWKNFPKCR